MYFLGLANLHLKAVTVIDPVTGWFEVIRYDDKIVITIANLVKTTWLYRYPSVYCPSGLI